MKKHTRIRAWKIGIAVLVAGFFAYPGSAHAIEVLEPPATNAQSAVIVEADERIEDDVLIVGDRVDIDGTVVGDVYVVSGALTVRGTIEGSLYIFSGNADVLSTASIRDDLIIATGQVVVDGSVGDDLLAASGSVALSGSVGDNVSIAAGDITTRSAFSAGRDVSLAVGEATIDGSVGRWLNLAADRVNVLATVTDGVRGHVDRLIVEEEATINGVVSVAGTTQPVVDDRATVTGAVEWSERVEDLPSNASVVGAGAAGALFAGSAAGVAKLLSNFIFGFLGSVLLGALLLWLWPHGFQSVVARAQWFPRKSGLIGLIIAIVAPFVLIVLLVTLVGAPFALLLGLVLFALGVMSTPVVGLWLGRWLLKRRTKPVHDVWAMSLGVLILSLIIAVPFVGILVKIAMVAMGLGAGWLTLRGTRPELV